MEGTKTDDDDEHHRTAANVEAPMVMSAAAAAATNADASASATSTKKELIIESGDIKGSVEVGPDDTLADVRVLLHEEFDDDMLPTCPNVSTVSDADAIDDFYFCVAGVRVSRKQERRKRAWDWVGQTVRILARNTTAIEKKRPREQEEEEEKKEQECFDDRHLEAAAEDSADNEYDAVAANGRRSRENTGVVDPNPTLSRTTGLPRSGVDVHLTPTKRKRRNKGQDTNYLQQGNCRVCHARTTFTCSKCIDEAGSGMLPEPWLCGTKKGKLCFATHMKKIHGPDL